MPHVDLTPGRIQLLRLAATILLLGVFGVGAFSLLLHRLSAIDSAISEITVPTTVPPVPQGCDFVADVDECPAPGPLDAPGIEGAVERYRNGVFAASDARFLVLSADDYRILLEPVFGPGEAQPGDVVMDVPVWEASFGDLPRTGTFSWEQQWRLVGGAAMFEQLFVLGSADDAEAFVANHEAFMSGKGVPRSSHPLAGDGREGARPMLFRFVDADASDPARRCVNRALGAVDRVVFTVSLLSGGDCSTPDPALPVGILDAVRSRAEAVLAR